MSGLVRSLPWGRAGWLYAAVAALVLVAGCVSASTATPSLTLTPDPGATRVSPSPTSQGVSSPTSSLIVPLPSLADVAAQVKPAVVSIVVSSQSTSIFGRTIAETSSGSGVIVDGRGYILTNDHVIEGAQEITVTLADGRVFSGTVHGADFLSDLAVVKIDSDNLPIARFGDADALRVGDWVIAIGNALGLPGGPTVTVGVVGALGRAIAPEGRDQYIYDLIQTDAAINPGNSGGPLINLAGEVIGINAAIIAGSDVQGLGFAVSTSTARPVFEELLQNRKVAWPYMGIQVDDVNARNVAQFRLTAKRGALITVVERNTPSSQAGLQAGDVIVKVGEQEVASPNEFIVALRRHRAGEKVTVAVARGQDQLIREITLAPRPD